MTTRPLIHLATDHAGLELKNEVALWLKEVGYTVIDHGAYQYDVLDDFPDFIKLAAEAVSKDPLSRAIIFGGSGQGEAMVANRYPHVRATVFYGGNEEIITLSRQHNDANVLSVGARFVTMETLVRVLPIWLTEPVLTDAKYERRNQKIERLTKSLEYIL
jgi:ribose 5-phosphate isomerase B